MAHYTRGRSELIVGLILVAAIIVFGVLFAVMTRSGITRHRSDLFVAIPTAHGLVKGDPVLFRGVDVGEVRLLDYASRADAVVVHVRLTRSVPLSIDAIARLSAVDLFGRQSLVLEPGAAELLLESGDTIRGFAPPTLTGRMDQLSERAERFLGDSTLLLLHSLMEEGRSVLRSIDRTVQKTDLLIESDSKHIEATLDQVLQLSTNLASTTDSIEIRKTARDLEAAAFNLRQLTARMDSTTITLGSVLVKLDSGKGSAARLLNDPLLYENAASAFARLDRLLLDIRQNPKRYINIRIF